MNGRRIVFPEPRRAQVEPFDLGDAAGGRQVFLEAEASVVSPGTEGAAFLGTQSLVPISYPTYPGYAWVGRVARNDTGDARLRVGDRVLAMKRHASHATLDPATEVWVPVPAGLPAEEAALARLLAVGATTLRTTVARPGDRVAVIGLGVVGLCAALLFQASGYDVVGVDVLSTRADRARDVGLRQALHGADDAIVEAVLSQTSGGCHLVIDATGNVRGELLALRVARDHGEVVLLGSPWAGGGDEPIGDLFQRIHLHYLQVRSGWEWALPRLPSPHVRGSIQENFALALGLIAAGKLPVRPLLTEVVAPEEAQRVYVDLTEHRDRCLTFAFRW
jgi:threonine dehydrogenase-like Zn-dependent dehydrogenase